jgi:hypothetical protein
MAKRRINKEKPSKLPDVRLLKEYLPITMSIVMLGVVIWLIWLLN